MVDAPPPAGRRQVAVLGCTSCPMMRYHPGKGWVQCGLYPLEWHFPPQGDIPNRWRLAACPLEHNRVELALAPEE